MVKVHRYISFWRGGGGGGGGAPWLRVLILNIGSLTTVVWASWEGGGGEGSRFSLGSPVFVNI